MPKLGMQPIRRRQLIDATIGAIHEYGFADATVARISRRAGVSSGIVHHYFADKDALLEATLRRLLEDLRRAVAARLAAAEGPMERVIAVLEANFAAEQFAPQTVSAWLAFWAQVPQSPALDRLHRISVRRTRSNLIHALRQLLSAAEAEAASLALAATMDGLWLRAAVMPGALSPAVARSIAREHFQAILARHGVAQTAENGG